jgi:hypothetical protein
MKCALTFLALAASANAFTTAPAAKSATALSAVFDKYPGAYDLRMKDFKFDPVSTS